ncbi:MAG: hypothetical protein ACRDD8_15765 [Bacteroidales bacterium]
MTLLRKTINSAWTIPIAILFLLIFSILVILDPAKENISFSLTGLLTPFTIHIASYWNIILISIILILGAFMSLHIVDRFNLIRDKSSLPFLFFIFLNLQTITKQAELPSLIAGLAIFVSYFYMLDAYQQEKSQRNIFNASLFFAFATLLKPELIFLFPILIFGLVHMRIAWFKNIGAIIFGCMAPFVASCTIYILSTGRNPDFSGFLNNFQWQLPAMGDFELPATIHNLITLVCVLIATAGVFFSSSMDKVRVRASAYYFLFSFLCFELLAFILPQKEGIFSLCANFFAAFILAYYFTIKKGRFNNYLFVLLLLTYVASAIWFI